MTVCVAAITEKSMVFGAADRMLTAGDIQFEPAIPKVFLLTNSIVALLAGDSALQTEIMQSVKFQVQRKVSENPKQWLPVGNVALIYAEVYRRARQRRTTNEVLAPLGLDANTFIGRQKEMDTDLVKHIASELVNYEMAPVQSIITGVDQEGPHLFVVNNGQVSCLDSVGFAAIGAGYWHANSQFMFGGHARWKPVPETLLLTYAAKKRAEVAPGVGEATDMFSIGPTPGSFFAIPEDVLASVDAIYQRIREKNNATIREGNEEVTDYVNKIAAAAAAQEEQRAQAQSNPDTGGNEGGPPPELLEPEDSPEEA